MNLSGFPPTRLFPITRILRAKGPFSGITDRSIDNAYAYSRIAYSMFIFSEKLAFRRVPLFNRFILRGIR